MQGRRETSSFYAFEEGHKAKQQCSPVFCPGMKILSDTRLSTGEAAINTAGPKQLRLKIPAARIGAAGNGDAENRLLYGVHRRRAASLYTVEVHRRICFTV